MQASWDCVDFENHQITILNPKNGTSNYLPMSRRCYDLLYKKRLQEPNNKFIFTNEATGTHYNNFSNSFKTVLKLADIKDLRFHDLRHTAATRLVAIGTPIPIIQKILNHKKIQTTMRYAHTLQEQKIEAMEALSKFSQ